VGLVKKINIPGVGPTNPVVLAAGGAAVVFVAWRWWQASSAAGAEAEAEALDASAEFDGVVGGDYAVGTYDAPTTQYSGGEYAVGDITETITTAPGTDAAWVQQAIEYLGGLGWDGAKAALALGRYLDRKPLTDAEADIVVAAKGILGNPPQSGDLPILSVVTPPAEEPPAEEPPAEKPPTTTTPKVYVTVKKGDTLSEIAVRHKTTMSKLRGFSENKYLFTKATKPRKRSTSGWWIYPGDRVRVK